MKDLFRIDFKEIFRGLFFSVLGTALILCLFFITYSLVFNTITSKPEKIKDIFEQSSIYTDLPGTLYDQAAVEAEGSPSELPLKDPEIRQIALDVYNPHFVQSTTENLIDGVYDWLEGKTEKPDIDLNFAGQNKELAGKVRQYVRKKAANLPACGSKQRENFREFKIYEAACLPSTVSLADAEKAADYSDSLLLDTRFTADDIKNADGEPLYKNFDRLPESFSLAKKFPFILTILALIFMLVIFYSSRDRVDGLKRLSRLILIAGVLIALLPFIFLAGINAIVSNLSGDDKATDIVRTLFEEFMDDASKIYYIVGVMLVLLSVGLYIYARRLSESNDKIPKTKN
jgi:hypothetical protein